MGEMRANFSEENMRSLPVPYCANRTCARMEAPFMNKSIDDVIFNIDKSQLSKKKNYLPIMGIYQELMSAAKRRELWVPTKQQQQKTKTKIIIINFMR